jgi:hypothetical protein
MAEALNVTGTDTISNGTDSAKFNDLIHGSSKAWVQFDGTGTIAIQDSYAVDSLTDNGTGDYDVNFTTNFASVNYGVAFGSQAYHTRTTAEAVGALNLETANSSATKADYDDISVICFGDQ